MALLKWTTRQVHAPVPLLTPPPPPRVPALPLARRTTTIALLWTLLRTSHAHPPTPVPPRAWLVGVATQVVRAVGVATTLEPSEFVNLSLHTHTHTHTHSTINNCTESESNPSIQISNDSTGEVCERCGVEEGRRGGEENTGEEDGLSFVGRLMQKVSVCVCVCVCVPV